jgi:hypothetical protein
MNVMDCRAAMPPRAMQTIDHERVLAFRLSRFESSLTPPLQLGCVPFQVCDAWLVEDAST